MRKLYIHIGVHKTGSTSLQNKLLENSYALLNSNAFYISTTGIFNKIPALKSYDENIVDYAKQTLLGRIKQFKYIDTFITSSENLSGDTSTGYKNSDLMANMLFDVASSLGIEVYIIAYIRRQDRFVESYYSHIVESGCVVPRFEKFVLGIDSEWFNWNRVIGSYENMFGKDRVIVRNYDHVTKNGGVLKDFCKIVNIPEIPNVMLNVSSSPASVELQRICNNYFRVNDSQDISRLIRVHNRGLLKNKTLKSGTFFKCNDRKDFMKKFSENNTTIALKYNIRPFDAVSNNCVDPVISDDDMFIAMLNTIDGVKGSGENLYLNAQTFLNRRALEFSIKIRKFFWLSLYKAKLFLRVFRLKNNFFS
jgi:hypothetical protein